VPKVGNISTWADEMLNKITIASSSVECRRAEALDAEMELRELISEAMHYGVTDTQIISATQLFSSSRLYQIKHRKRT
jgi:hypothetical protein